jgi:hypothetical protein
MKRMTEEITAVIERGLRAELLRERQAAIEAELVVVRAEIVRLGGEVQTPPAAVKAAFAPVPAPKPAPANRPMVMKSTHALIIELMKAAGRPMKVRELTDAMLKRGWRTTRDNPSRTVDKALRRNFKDFRLLAPGTFELIR